MTGYQCYATADVGSIAFETSARQGLVVDEGVLLELCAQARVTRWPEGEVGELVVTTLNPDLPADPFWYRRSVGRAAGRVPDRSHQYPHQGLDGRADQTTKIRGMFVHPGQVNTIVKRFPEITRARLVVSGEMANDTMTLKVEAAWVMPMV
jgi:phenylacetate-CoA ligase